MKGFIVLSIAMELGVIIYSIITPKERNLLKLDCIAEVVNAQEVDSDESSYIACRVKFKDSNGNYYDAYIPNLVRPIEQGKTYPIWYSENLVKYTCMT